MIFRLSGLQMIIDHMLKEVTKSGKGFVQVRVLARDPVYNPPKARREEVSERE